MKLDNKKLFIIILVLLVIIIPITIKIKNIIEYEIEQYRIKNATVLVELKDNLNIPFYSSLKTSDLITSINGNIINDDSIDTTSVGEKEISFEYINDEGIKIPYKYNINIIDDVAPTIWLNSSYIVYKDYNGNLEDDIICADNYDDHPECKIEGEYDFSKNGSYNLKFIAKDFSNNETVKEFTLIVKDPPKNKNDKNEEKTHSNTLYTDILNNYKNDNTKIGIDVSGWQGDIDYEKVRDSSVDFVYIKVGGTLGLDGNYYVDSKFKQNIEGFNKVGIPVGIYFYSHAKTEEEAKNDANWVLNQIKDYDIELPIAYDWENWSNFNNYEQSFYTLSKNAKVFLDIIKDNNYEGILYSSKTYLEKVWYDIGYPVWLAHYNKQTNYEGNYKYWQICDNGFIDGINTEVDIDIMFLNK